MNYELGKTKPKQTQFKPKTNPIKANFFPLALLTPELIILREYGKK